MRIKLPDPDVEPETLDIENAMYRDDMIMKGTDGKTYDTTEWSRPEKEPMKSSGIPMKGTKMTSWTANAIALFKAHILHEIMVREGLNNKGPAVSGGRALKTLW